MKEIKFFPKSEEAEVLVEKPKPAQKYIPEWYKKMPAFEGNKPSINISDAQPNSTAKMCVPFSDSFHMGYIVETWCDISIECDDSGELTNYIYSSGPQIMGHRDSPSNKWPEEYHTTEFVWKMQWIPQLPEGHSVIYTHPFNRPDLPFFSLTGIVDSDKFKFEREANHPFLIKRGFSGIIPAGTPFIQIIPFKRDGWKSEFLEYDRKKQLNSQLPRKIFWGGYKKMFWTKKVFK